jgi:hypothetical protein
MVSSPPCACVRVLADVDHNDGSLLQPPEDVDLLRAASCDHSSRPGADSCHLREDGGAISRDQHGNMIQVCLLLSGTAFAFAWDRIGSSICPSERKARKARNPSRSPLFPFAPP